MDPENTSYSGMSELMQLMLEVHHSPRGAQAKDSSLLLPKASAP